MHRETVAMRLADKESRAYEQKIAEQKRKVCEGLQCSQLVPHHPPRLGLVHLLAAQPLLGALPR